MRWYLLLLFLVGFPVFDAQAGQPDETPSWTIDFLDPPVELQQVQDLISFNDQLYIFNTVKKFRRLYKQAPGVLVNDHLEMLPSFDSSTRDIEHTLWNNQLIIAGHLPLISFPDESLPRFSTRLAAFDGKSWQLIGQGFKGRISALISWRGKLIVAGSLDIEGHPELHSLAQWNGQQWEEVSGQPSGGGEARIKCLAVHNGNLVVGGIFSEIGGVVIRNLASFDGKKWSGLGGAANGLIAGIVSFDGNLIANGRFSCIGGQAIEELARWDGKHWHSMNVLVEPPFKNKSHDQIIMLPTPDGLYMAGHMANFTGKKDQKLALWTSDGWDSDIPTIHIETLSLERIKPNDPNWYRSDPKELSKPRRWPSGPFYHEVPKLRKYDIESFAWHQNELILSAVSSPSEYTTLYDYRLLSLRSNSLHNMHLEEASKRREVGQYRGGTLFIQGNRNFNSNLLWQNDEFEEVLGSWISNNSYVAPGSFLVQGDTIFVAGTFESFAGLPCHHTAFYDGTQWQTMGDGIPFDKIISPQLHTTKEGLYLTGRFSNRHFLLNTGLMKWNGRQWSVAELDTALYARGHVQSDGTWLFRANTDHPVYNQFRSPDHKMQSFPAESIPFIERWNEGHWERVWQGQSGRVGEFVHGGQTLWCTIVRGRDINLLKLVDEQWITMCDLPIAGTGITKINSLGSLHFHEGQPIINLLQHKENQNNRYRLASLHQGKWYFFGPSFAYSNKFWTEENQLHLEADFFLNLEETIRHGILHLDGPILLAEPVPIADLELLDKWEETCRASDQGGKPELDLPLPRGLERSSEIIKGQKAGWYMSTWADSVAMESTFETRGKSTIILKPNSGNTVSFFFPWDTDQAGLFTFEYRLVGFENWPPDGGSSWDRNGQRKDSPSFYASINSAQANRELWAEDGKWHKIYIPFGKDYEIKMQEINFSGGKTEKVNGHLEIKNIRIEKKKFESHKKLTKEITKLWKKYPCPEEPKQRIKLLCKKFDRYYNDLADSRNTSLYSNSGLVKGLLLTEDCRTWEGFGSKNDELKLVVDNLSGGGKVSAGWTAGGGLYVRSHIIDHNFEPDGFLHKLHADTSQIRTVKGLIIDMRRSDYFKGAPSHIMFTQANHYMSLFADKAYCWGKVQEGTKNSPLSDLTIQPAAEPWTKVPVVVLVSENTPGCVVMILNSLPNVSTVGRPSTPVGVPTQPHLLPNGVGGDFPAGWVYDAEGNDVSLCRIGPDVVMPLNASWDAAIREAMLLLGLKPDPESNFCPVEIILPGG